MAFFMMSAIEIPPCPLLRHGRNVIRFRALLTASDALISGRTKDD